MVAQKKPNGYRLYDMSGNVEEWVWDSDYIGNRYYCGGSWSSNEFGCLVGSRYDYYANSRNNSVGFRLVCLIK